MTADFLDLRLENLRRLADAGYDPAAEHDACGTGIIAALDGVARREVVAMGIEAMGNLGHRGAVDADGKTGDGAGILVEIPQEFFHVQIERLGQTPGEGAIAVGMIFLPRTDIEAQERCRGIVETEILSLGYGIAGWRQVPVDISVIGEKANASRPEIEQILITNDKSAPEPEFERELYIIRRRIEKAAEAERIGELYVCSLSSRTVIYKGMFLAEQLAQFYPDLADPRFVSRFVIFHQRYSTNTFPTWRLAQPFRMIAHNGEVNTLKGNVNWMKAHETRLYHPSFGKYMEDLKPIIQPGSDSAQFDNVFELICRAGREAPFAKLMMVPEAWHNKPNLPAAHRGLYAYCNSVMEPWDGPMALCATDGEWVLGGMDRNGLRPMRYSLTRDKLLVLGSETGLVRLDPERVVEKGRIGPGEMIAVKLDDGRLYRDREVKDRAAARRPWLDWTRHITPLDELVRRGPAAEPAATDRATLRRRQNAFGLTVEDMEMILQPMVEDAKEAVGSMGDDSPLALLSARYRGLHHFFRQNFSQVTNPPIDSLRERRVMSLRTRLGNLSNILDEDESQSRVLQLDSPVLSNAEFAALRGHLGESAVELDCTFEPGRPDALRRAVTRLRHAAADAVRGGAAHLILTDQATGPGRAPVPMILATAAIHTHLIRQSLRTFTSLNIRSGECLDVHYFAVLVGVGATTVNAWLTEDAIADRHARGLFGALTMEQCLYAYRKAVDDGLLKIMSKMGISVISSYRGGCNFEAVGLSRALVSDFFPNCPSRISGIGLGGIQEKVLGLHARAFVEGAESLSMGGFYRFRAGAERHAWEADAIHTLQTAVTDDSYDLYKRYVKTVRDRPPVNLRDLLDFQPVAKPAALSDVESITALRKRFVTPGMSLGALSPEAHGTLNVAMNRIGAKSDSGEGGEDPARFKPDRNGDNWNSAIKQVGSGRFGVTAEYLNQCRELEIKVAQGAKPGEGGQLPGFKVTEFIARLRHSTPGVMLISPPPHHDIYSIEDLAQLIYDLKQINPTAKVCVKLVARTGIGTIAAGVAKAKADVILISGHNGGTGASPQSSIKYAGLPWEMGLSEAHQVLTLNRLRHRVVLRTDGGIKTGRDVVIAAMLGAEEYGIGTAALVAMGCIMVRQCHSNTCPVGVCTQKPELRERFTGSPEKVVNLFGFIAQEVREILAKLGLTRLEDAIGRTDLLHQISRGDSSLDELDLNPLLIQPAQGDEKPYCTMQGRNEVPDTLDAQIIRDAGPLFDVGEKMQLAYTIQNTHRSIGARLSSHITRKFGMAGLQPGHLTLSLAGTAGQSLGAFAVQGMRIVVTGDANDYVGKGLSGGTIIVRPPHPGHPRDTIIGNTVLYGATSGELFAAGEAGERFAVRNSGATAVIEGCGSNGCEYMTGGTAVILGPVGVNFAAGMTGGMAYVLDAEGTFPLFVNPDSVVFQRIAVPHYADQLQALVRRHLAETGSPQAARLLADWPMALGHIWQVVPKEIVPRLAVPILPADAVKVPAE